MSVLLVAIIGWCIRTAWESTEEDDIWQISLAVIRRTRIDLLKRVKELNPFCTRYVPRHDNITLTHRPGEVRV